MQSSIGKDARDFQIIFLALFLLLGVHGRDFTIDNAAMAAALAGSLITQFVGDRLLHSPKPSLRSAWITGLSLCLLLRSNSLLTMLLAGFLSIAQKFVLRYRGKHFFNPSNFGIVAVLVFTSDAWVSPGQWGQSVWLALLFCCAGGMVVNKVGRWETTGAFLFFFGGLEFARNAWLGWEADVFFNRLMNGGLLLFSFFMITDPRAIPDNRTARIVWSAMVAILAFILRNKFFLPTSIFWALFALSPLTILFDRIWPANRFEWSSTGPERKKYTAWRILSWQE